MPETYDAATTYLQQMDFAKITEPPVAVRAKEDFELFFFFDPAMRHVEGALRGWMSYPEEMRGRMIKEAYVDGVTSNGVTAMMAGPGRTKSLLWILYKESTEPGGSVLVARSAFNCLFPKKV